MIVYVNDKDGTTTKINARSVIIEDPQIRIIDEFSEVTISTATPNASSWVQIKK